MLLFLLNFLYNYLLLLIHIVLVLLYFYIHLLHILLRLIFRFLRKEKFTITPVNINKITMLTTNTINVIPLFLLVFFLSICFFSLHIFLLSIKLNKKLKGYNHWYYLFSYFNLKKFSNYLLSKNALNVILSVCKILIKFNN